MLTVEERIKLRDELFNILKDKTIISISTRWKRYIFPSNRSKLKRELENNKEFYEKYNLYVKEFKSESEAQYCITHEDDYTNHVCPICKTNLCEFYIDKTHYKKTCNNHKCIQDMIHTKEARNKFTNTMKKKYGVEHALEVKEFKNKFKETCKERYGVEYPAQNKDIYSKVEQTNLERYGDTCSARNKDVKNKMINTNLERYGVEYTPCSKEFKQNILDKYNVENYNQRHITNYEIWINEEKFKEYIINKYNEKKMFLVFNDIAWFFNVGIDSLHDKIKKLQLENYFQIKDSSLEIQFKEFLINNGINITDKDRHNRNIILNENTNKYLEIDFVIPNTNIAFEINDIATHNSLNPELKHYKDMYYHFNKTRKALSKNVYLIHIWEWELINELIWKNISKWILNLINTNYTNLSYKECDLKLVPIDEEKEFLDNYNIYGYTRSDICIGLYYKDKLIELMSFKNNTNDSYEILRTSIKYGYSIDYGFNKIFICFLRTYNPNSIIAYYSLDKINNFDCIYESLGFKISNIIKPNIIWCNKELEYFKNEDNKFSSYDEIISNNYIPIYDCGKVLYDYIRGR